MSHASVLSSPAAAIQASPRDRAVARAGAALAVLGLGFVVAALLQPSLLEVAYALLNTASTTPSVERSALVGAGLYGAFMVGWGVTMVRAATGRTLTAAMRDGLLAWFVLDSVASLWLGFGWNALSNLGFLVVFVLLLRPLRQGNPDGPSREGA